MLYTALEPLYEKRKEYRMYVKEGQGYPYNNLADLETFIEEKKLTNKIFPSNYKLIFLHMDNGMKIACRINSGSSRKIYSHSNNAEIKLNEHLNVMIGGNAVKLQMEQKGGYDYVCNNIRHFLSTLGDDMRTFTENNFDYIYPPNSKY